MIKLKNKEIINIAKGGGDLSKVILGDKIIYSKKYEFLEKAWWGWSNGANREYDYKVEDDKVVCAFCGGSGNADDSRYANYTCEDATVNNVQKGTYGATASTTAYTCTAITNLNANSTIHFSTRWYSEGGVLFIKKGIKSSKTYITEKVTSPLSRNDYIAVCGMFYGNNSVGEPASNKAFDYNKVQNVYASSSKQVSYQYMRMALLMHPEQGTTFACSGTGCWIGLREE